MATTKTYQGMIYSKTFSTAEGKKFSKYLFKTTTGKTYDCIIQGTLKAKIIAEGWAMPSMVTISEKSYFVKKEKYTTKEGEVREKQVVVLLAIDKHEPAQFEAITLDELE